MAEQASRRTTIATSFKSWLTSHKDQFRLGVKVAALIAALWLLFGVCFGLHRISGPAMSERLEDGDLVLYTRLAGDYKSGDVIIYEHDGGTYVSAILAVADDVIEVDSYGHLSLNGILVSDNIAFTPEQKSLVEPSAVLRVPSNSYYVLNENLDSLEDSRSFGAIPSKDIKGKIIGLLRTRSI